MSFLLALLVFVSLVVAHELQEDEKCLISNSNVAFIQVGGVVHFGSDAANAEDMSGTAIEPKLITMEKCQCPNKNSLGCVEMSTGATFTLSLPQPSPNAVGGTVQFTTKVIPTRRDLFGIAVGSSPFLPFISMTQRGELLTKSLKNAAWALGLCSELDTDGSGNRVFRLCYIAYVGEEGKRDFVKTMVEPLIDVTNDIVTFAIATELTKRPADSNGKLYVAVTSHVNRDIAISKPLEIAVPLVTDGLLRIGYQGVNGLSAIFDTFYGLVIDETTNPFNFDRARVITPYICIRPPGPHQLLIQPRFPSLSQNRQARSPRLSMMTRQQRMIAV
jgi:hypothetical protein